MLRLGVVLICAPIVMNLLLAHDIITTNLTYSRDISRILARRCAECHGPGAAIPLTSYEEARPWAVGIKEQVLARSMPPWGAVKGFGNLKPDNALTQEEIMIFAAWVIGGAPQGDPALLQKQGHGKEAQPQAVGRDAVTAVTRVVLDRQVRANGIRPLADAESARIVARLPDGRVQPLVWLYRFDAKWNRTFFFREPIDLPQGTEVESSAPLKYAIETPE
jgi:hypothetical protein